MRLSVPTIPPSISAAYSRPTTSISASIQRVAEFISPGNVTILTGAGASVDSGIRAYRGDDGRYLNPNYKPIFYHELTAEGEKGHKYRQRYWLRSYLGYPTIMEAQPNPTHFAIAALQYSAHIPRLITQNVDGLHHKALNAGNLGSSRIHDSIVELHGTLHRVHCNRGHVTERKEFQHRLSEANPKWRHFAEEIVRTNSQPRTNPDGDVAVEHLGIAYDDFQIPHCPTCLQQGHRNSNHKPEVVFFGESLSPQVRDKSYTYIDACDRLLLLGTTLATYSAFRLLKHAVEIHKPVLMINVGPSRADGIPEVEKVDIESGSIMREVVKMVVGPGWNENPVISNLLSQGIVKVPS